MCFEALGVKDSAKANSTLHIWTLSLARLPVCLVSSAACDGEAGFPSHGSSCFSNFPSRVDLVSEWPPRCSTCPHTHVHIPVCVCRGSGFVAGGPTRSDRTPNSTAAGGGGGGKKIRATMCRKNVTDLINARLPPFWQLTKVWNEAVSPRPCGYGKEREGLCLHSSDWALKTNLQPTVSSWQTCLSVVLVNRRCF